MTRPIATLVAAALLVVAGCAGGLAPAPVDDGSGDTGTVAFYVSDQRNAIDQFEHLNVTITTVGFAPAEGDDATATNVSAASGSATNGSAANGSGNATPALGDAEAERVTVDVDDRTVDLTELQGDNATKLADVALPEGTYAGVFVRVGEVNGTLTTGEQVDVKLPSETLRLGVPLTVGPNGSVDYVFDITVHEAGNSGMYILRPVVGESGPDVPIRDVGRAADAGPPEDAGNAPDDAGPSDDAGSGPGDAGNESDAGGPPADAGTGSDGGPPEDAGNETSVSEQAALGGVLVGDGLGGTA